MLHTMNTYKRVINTLKCSAAALILAACSGGGGSGTSSAVLSGTNAAGTVNTRQTAPSVFSGTAEFQRNFGLAAINAAEAYAANGGVAGEGVRIAIIDSGLDTSNPDLNVVFNSSLVPFVSPHSHGTLSAGIAAARRNGSGSHGVAFNADLVGLGVMTAGSANAFDSVVTFSQDVAVGIASAAGITREFPIRDTFGRPQFDSTGQFLRFSDGRASSDIINLSLFSADTNGVIRGALQEAAQRDRIIVIASGNNSRTEVSSPANYVIDPLVAGNAIAVGSVDANGNFSSFSNQCGRVAQYCLVAPGTAVTGTRVGGGITTASGTSFAAPHVSGALAVLKSMFPGQSAEALVNRVLSTARPLDGSADGISAVWGHGLLDLEAAVSPVGGSVAFTDATRSTSVNIDDTSLALGGALAGAGASFGEILTHDSQGFAFHRDLDDQIQRRTARSHLAELIAPRDGATRNAAAIGSTSLNLTRSDTQSYGRWAGFSSDAERTTVTGGQFTFADETNSVTVRHGERAALSPVLASPRGFHALDLDAAFAPQLKLAGAGSGLSSVHALNNTVSMTTTAHFGQGEDGRSDTILAATGLTKSFGALKLGVEAGAIIEQDSAAGTRFAGAFGHIGSSTTTYLHATASYALTSHVSVVGSFFEGQTEASFDRQGIFTGLSDLGSRAVALGLQSRDTFRAGDQLSFTVSQPLRVHSGSASYQIADGEDSNGRISFRNGTTDLAATGREMTLSLGYTAELVEDTFDVGVTAFARFQPDHQRDASAELGAGARATFRF